jgi:hypothetical protein
MYWLVGIGCAFSFVFWKFTIFINRLEKSRKPDYDYVVNDEFRQTKKWKNMTSDEKRELLDNDMEIYRNLNKRVRKRT